MVVQFFKLNGEHQDLTMNPTDTLAGARKMLGAFMPSSFRFMGVSGPAKRPKMIDPGDEGDWDIQYTVNALGGPKISMVDSETHTPIFSGTKVNWFTDRNLQVAIALNNVDNEAKQVNTGKFNPYLVDGIRNGLTNEFTWFDKAPICVKGSAITFQISCWAAAGYGYSIKSDRETIVEDLYIMAGDSPGRQMNTDLRRYERSKNIILVDATASMNIGDADKTQYAKVTIRAWKVTSYKKGGKTYSFNGNPPFRRGDGDPGGFREVGGVVFSGEDVETAAPHMGGAGGQDFGTVTDVVEDRNDVLGELELYFLVFRDKAAADRVIAATNAPGF